MYLADIAFVVPELFLTTATIILLMFGVFMKNSFTRSLSRLSIFTLAITIYLILMVPTIEGVTFHNLLISNSFILFAKFIILAAAAVVILISIESLKGENAFFEFPVIILLSVIGMMIMVSSNDFITLYMGLEMQSLSLYILAASNHNSIKSSEAGLKYFILGALASGIFLFGVSMIYGFAGTTSFSELAKIYTYLSESEKSLSLGVMVGMIMIIIALCFKISAVPFHMWVPDVYEGSPTPVTAFFATVPKVAALILFIRVMQEAFGGLVDQWGQIIQIIAAASMILGAIAAIKQKNIKRLMAYSSIGHVGYILLGLLAGETKGIQAVLIYISIYVIMSIGTFTCILLMKRDGKHFEDIKDLAGISKTNPIFALVFSVFMFSMAGIPPLAGFFAKFYIFLAAVEKGLYMLSIVGVMASVIAAYYYLNIVKIIYFDEGDRAIDRRYSFFMKATLLLASLFNLFMFIYPAPFFDIAKDAASALFS